MTSRRPMARSFSGNGRTGSFSEEEGSSSNGRSESRNPYLSNVRPENRSTLCSVMAQLTEDIQPSFENTLKSKAVSEKCNVKFTCEVSGYPAPELKWYKDDMEMDRYCGLPKYEIHRNGKIHTLHIYNCTLDDAAIYQVSASNSKGIVSCSGVLEVGTMNEFKIHQRFFAKLKQKAEKKKNELDEHAKKGDKENIQKEKPQCSPERPQRKRHVPPLEKRPAVNEPEPMEQLGAAAEPNGVSSAPVTSKDLEKEISPSEETLAKKKIKITNGVDAEVNSSSSKSSGRTHIMGNGGENCYDGGIGLAQFLAETLQSQAAEEKQNSSRGETPKEMNIPIVSASKEREQERMQKVREEQGKEEDYVREKMREEELATEREKEKERLLEMSHTISHTKHGSQVKHQSKAHKDHDPHNIQASLSSVLHSVKDFFFGKSKKDSHDHIEKKDREFDHSPASTPPSVRLQPEQNQVCKPLKEDVVHMEIDKPKEPSKTVDIEQLSVSLKPHEHKHEDSVLHTVLPSAHKLPPGSVEEHRGESVKAADSAVEAMVVSVGPESSGPDEEMSLSGLQVLTKAEEKDSQIVSAIKEVPVHQQEPDSLAVSPQPYHLAAREESSPREEISLLLQTQAPYKEERSPTSTLTSLQESWTPPHNLISSSNSQSLGDAPTKTLREEKMNVDKMGNEGEPDTVESSSSNKLSEEEKAEVKSNKQPCSDISRYEIAELTTCSLEERIEPYQSKTPDHVLLHLPAVATYGSVEDKVKEQTNECTSLQEMNVEFPPSAAPESLEKGDLKMEQSCTSSIVSEVHNVNAIQSSSAGFSSSEEGRKLKEGLNSALDLEVNACNNLKEQEAILEGESNETRNESLQFEVETEKIKAVKVEELDEPKNLSVRQNKKSNAYVLEERSNVEHQDSSEIQQCRPSLNIPQIQISTIDDIPDINPTVAGVNPNEHFIIPKIEIMEPELKESTLPLTILALKKEESEPDANLVSEVVTEDQNVVMHTVLPMQNSTQNDSNLSPIEKLKEVAQLDDKTKICEREPPHMKSSEQLPHWMDYTSIPVINVSCTDDKEDDVFANAHVSDTEQPVDTPTVPLFVVPPISVTCPLPTQSECTETETSASPQMGTKHDAGDNNTTAPEITQSGKQNQEETAEKSIKENTPSMLYEALIPKVDNNVSFSRTTEDNVVPEVLKANPVKETKIDNSVSVEDLQRNRSSVERLSCKPPTHPSLSPASLRKFMSKAALDSDIFTNDKADEDVSGGSTPTSSLSCESSPQLKRRDSLSLIRSATPEELASGARRKIFIPKPKEDGEGAVVGALDTQGKKDTPYMSPSQARRAALLQAPTGQNTPPMEKRSPLLSRRKVTLEVPKVVEETPTEEPVSTKQEEKPAEKKLDPLKAPQVIRKIRGEPFPDASGHLKLWCQFFNVLSDSTIKWYRDEEEILELNRSGGDESQVALAVVLASSHDCAVYGCSINNEYGTDTTDFLLSEDILSEILLKDHLEVGEEIEMTPMLFSKGLADCGSWGEKYFGRIMTETVQIGEGCAHKASRVKVIYGLDPVFESGSACIIKVQSPIAYGNTKENNLAERNLQITKHECKVQNMIREYCKIFAAEARVIENFGFSLEVIPQYLMYRPANSVPYARVEANLQGVFLKYCMMDPKGRLITQTGSEVEQKCNTFQHWIHQWTHGNLLVTRLEGVETKITNVRVVTKSKGYQGLTEQGSPEVFEQFLTHHQCNYYCGLLGLRSLKSVDSLQQPTKIKGSRSPLLNRKVGSNSPQLQRKGHSPQMSRKGSPKVTRKVQEAEDNKSGVKPKPAETANVLEVR
ncbi:LOW QUALITY PROTEIN: alpha-protein kinase 3 [Cottoperca gobio]|uniref:non-specific serine/threonine protein kinase n=1 Tax=Cottoperca gobio TaxID=56716 RepID=A0A6J2PVI4_COTGO|nr:LOW QUALITY PROTEIN: alpha-protein kinase 3-like [Cottoperca gobio]